MQEARNMKHEAGCEGHPFEAMGHGLKFIRPAPNEPMACCENQQDDHLIKLILACLYNVFVHVHEYVSAQVLAQGIFLKIP